MAIVVCPQDGGIVDHSAIELGTKPPVIIAHRFVETTGKVGGSAAPDEIGQEQLFVVNRISMCLRAIITVDRTERLFQLNSNPKVHCGVPPAGEHYTTPINPLETKISAISLTFPVSFRK
jgi:hypothetical protein